MTFEEAKQILRENSIEIVDRRGMEDPVCQEILTAIYFYNRFPGQFYERKIIEATEKFLEERK